MLDLYKMLLLKKFFGGSGGGGEAVLVNKSISANGEFSASSDDADGYKKVTVSVPNSYSAADEGKVVSGGALVSQTAHATVTENGVIDTTLNNSVEVDVQNISDTLTIKGIWSVDMNWWVGLPVKYKIEADKVNNVYFRSGDAPNLTNVEEVEVSANSTTSVSACGFDIRADAIHALKKVNLNFIPFANFYTFSCTYGVDKNPYFETILGLNFINIGGGNYKIGSFSKFGALKHITCKPNTLGQLDLVASNRNWWGFPDASLLTDDSLCQIANALCATHTSTLTLHATPKARCSTLMGTVSSVTDDTGTYNFFTQDENGTTTLADFITQTKGWTLA